MFQWLVNHQASMEMNSVCSLCSRKSLSWSTPLILLIIMKSFVKVIFNYNVVKDLQQAKHNQHDIITESSTQCYNYWPAILLIFTKTCRIASLFNLTSITYSTIDILLCPLSLSLLLFKHQYEQCTLSVQMKLIYFLSLDKIPSTPPKTTSISQNSQSNTTQI